MDKLELYKFARENVDEWHWEYDGHLWISVSRFINMRDLTKLLTYNFFEDGYNIDHSALLSDGSVALIDFDEYCEMMGFDAAEIFDKDKTCWEE